MGGESVELSSISVFAHTVVRAVQTSVLSSGEREKWKSQCTI